MSEDLGGEELASDDLAGIDFSDPEGPCTAKLWVGFLSSELEEAAAPGEPDDDPAIDFGGSFYLARCSQLDRPCGRSVRFVSAQSGSAEERQALRREEGFGGFPPPAPLRRPEPAPLRPGLDAGVVRSARDAGISTEQLRRLSVLLQKPNKMQEPTSSRPQKRGVLSASEEEEEEAEAVEGEAEPEAREPMEKAVLQLTKLVANMSKPKRASAGLEGILERCDGGSGEVDGDWQRSSGVASKSKASAFKKLKAALTDSLEWI
eukprot:s5181_g4.t1